MILFLRLLYPNVIGETNHTSICQPSDLQVKNCQKWDLNPRLHVETRSPFAQEGVSPWVWRLRPLGHPDTKICIIQSQLYKWLVNRHLRHCRRRGCCPKQEQGLSHLQKHVGWEQSLFSQIHIAHLTAILFPKFSWFCSVCVLLVHVQVYLVLQRNKNNYYLQCLPQRCNLQVKITVRSGIWTHASMWRPEVPFYSGRSQPWVWRLRPLGHPDIKPISLLKVYHVFLKTKLKVYRLIVDLDNQHPLS